MSRSPSEQLSLPLEAGAAASDGLPRSVPAMLPDDGEAPFDDEAFFFEPWWPGTRALAFVGRASLRISADHLADPLASFPELGVIREQMTGDDAVLDGTLLVLDADGRPDRDLLRQRLAEPSARNGTGAFVASDMLWQNGRSIAALPFADRLARLVAALRDGDRCVVTRGLRGEGTTLAEAVALMGLDTISARRLDASWHAGPAAGDWLRIPIEEAPAPQTGPLLVLINRLPLD
jgi:bifunctional non-homologous end joining protein LigD